MAMVQKVMWLNMYTNKERLLLSLSCVQPIGGGPRISQPFIMDGYLFMIWYDYLLLDKISYLKLN